MAHLKDLIVSGVSRFLGTVYAKLFKGDLEGTASNADKLDGLHSASFVNYKYSITDTEMLNNANYKGAPYEGCVSDGSVMGLASHWWHIKYFRHANTDGYGCQVAFPLDRSTELPQYRISIGPTWQPWKAIGDGIASNPNLLTNPDFKINQRGLTEYSNTSSTSLYCVDRWCYNGTCTLSDNGLIVSSSGSAWGYGVFQQVVENVELTKYMLTLQLKVNGVVNSVTWIPVSNAYSDRCAIMDGDTAVGYARMVSNDTISRIAVEFIIYQNYQMTIEWVKLEVGQVATQFIPPDPATELMKCQKYYKEIRGIYTVSVVSTNEIQISINNGSLDMIRTPKLSFKNNSEFNTPYGVRMIDNVGGTINGFTFTAGISTYDNMPCVVANKTSHGLTRTGCFLFMGKSNYLCFDAEYYRE